jgi:hypothetical protein
MRFGCTMLKSSTLSLEAVRRFKTLEPTTAEFRRVKFPSEEFLMMALSGWWLAEKTLVIRQADQWRIARRRSITRDAATAVAVCWRRSGFGNWARYDESPAGVRSPASGLIRRQGDLRRWSTPSTGKAAKPGQTAAHLIFPAGLIRHRMERGMSVSGLARESECLSNPVRYLEE